MTAQSPAPPAAPRGPWRALGSGLVRHARPVALVMLGLSAASAILAGVFLRVRPGYVDLLDPRSELQRRYLQLLEELGNVEALHVVVQAEDPARAAHVADRLAEGVRALVDAGGKPQARSVVSRVDLRPLRDRAPAWLSAGALDRIAALPGLPQLVADPEAHRLLAAMRAEIASASAEAAASGGRAVPALAGVLGGLADVASGRTEPGADAVIAGVTAPAAEALDTQGHVVLGPGRLLVTVMPADTSNDAALLEGLVEGARRAARDAVAEAGGGVEVSFTGAPALIVDEMRAVRRDVALASGLSFVLVTLLFFVSFNSLRHVAFAAIANGCGLALTFGAAYVLVGYLNLFSSVFAAVLAGLGIDFGIHFINFYEARRREGLAAGPALVATYEAVVPPIAVSAVTTAAAFLMVMTSEFAGFSQLGLISGAGVLLCLLTAFTLVPALLAWEARRRPGHPAASRAPWSLPFLMMPVRAARAVALISVLVLGAAGWSASRLQFDHDLMNLQPAGTEAVALQRDGDERVGTHPAISLAPDAASARRMAAAFRALPEVASVQTPAEALPEPDPDRPAALRRLVAALAAPAAPSGPASPPTESPVPTSSPAPTTQPAGTPVAPLDAARAEAAALHDELVSLQDLAFEGGSAGDVASLDAPIAAAAELVQALKDDAAGPRLQALRDDFAARLASMAALLPGLAERGVTASDLPDALAGLVGSSGRMAVVVVPRRSVWDRPELVRFLAAVRTVDAAITGPAVQVAEVTELMRTSLRRAALLALLVIIALVGISTRSLPLTALSLLPLLSGFVLMLGLMKWLHVPLNPANLVALPLLLGIGVDGGVHLVHRWHETRDAARAVADVGHALLITSLTTVAGFLPLLLARHRGIRSLGAATCLGSLGMLLAVIVVAPAFLAIVDLLRRERAA